jgi:DNA-binding CsgD family transcriptional regulator/tetratricopeptide (TPR) repeat protein
MEPGWFERLNQREAEILQLISEGLSNREIAQKLFLAIETIKWYNKQIYSKLGVSSRIQAASVARQHGLLRTSVFSGNQEEVPLRYTLQVPHFFQKTFTVEKAPFVARQQELAILNTDLDRSLTGLTSFIFVTGEAGRGKTSLLSEFARQAQLNKPDLIVVNGYCTAQTGIGDPYLPFRDILGMLCGDLESRWIAGAILPEQAQRLWAFLPYTIQAIIDHGPDLLNILISGKALVKRVSPYVLDSTDWQSQLLILSEQQLTRSAHLEQYQVFDQVTRVFQALSKRQPLLILIDDLQWADSASLNLLFHLGRRLSTDRIMFLGAYRASEVPDTHPLTPIQNEYKRRFGDVQIDLEKYDPLEGQTFVNELLDTESNRLGMQFRDRLFWYTKGHPLFTVELLRHLQEHGNLVQDASGHWIEKAAFESGDLPVRVEAVIQQRIGHLNPVQQELLTIAAVEGEVFTAQVAARIQQVDEKVIFHLLSEMEEHHHLVREHSEIQVGERYLNRYQFSHSLFQQYLYQKLSQGERRLLHGRLAEELEKLYQGYESDIAVQLAYHFTQFGKKAQATTYLLMAGDSSWKGAAFKEAADFYRRALSGFPASSKLERAETLRKLGECVWLTGQLSEALEAFADAYRLYENLEDRIGAGATQRLIGRIYWEFGQRETSLEHYDKAYHILENGPENVELARVISAISQMHMLASEYEQAITWGQRALEMAEHLGAEDVIVHVLNNLGTSLTSSTDYDRGFRLLQDSLERALALNLPHDICRAYVNTGESFRWHCRFEEAVSNFEKLLAFARQVHMVQFEGVALVNLAGLDNWAGRWKKMLARCEQIRAWRETSESTKTVQVMASTILGRVYNDLGQTNQARLELENHISYARSLDEIQFTVPYIGEMARTLVANSLEIETIELVREFLALIDRTPSLHVDCIPSLIFACRWLAKRVELQSDELFHSCLNRLEWIETQFHTLESKAALVEAQGYEALNQHSNSLAIELFHLSETHWNDLGRPYDQLWSLNALGQTLYQAGFTEESQLIYNQAVSIIDALAAQLENDEQRASFLTSILVQDIKELKKSYS